MERTIPISRLHASETQTLRLLALIKDMVTVLRTAASDGVSDLLDRAVAVEAGVRTDLPNSILLRETLEQAEAYFSRLRGDDDPMVQQIRATLAHA